jgi:Putative Ig domain
LLFRQDIVKTFSGETVRKLRALSLVVVGILVWALVFAGCSGSSSLTVTLSPASGESLNPGATVTITATLTNDKNNQGVTWTLSGPGQLSSNTTTSVVYTAPSNISTSTTATITATSVANSSVTATESITLTAVLTIATTSLPAGALGVSYNTFVSAEGATGTFTWTITAGSLPAGLTFQTTTTSSSAQITGTPTLLETSKFTVQVTDAAGSSVTQALSITINPPPPLSVATGSLPDGTVNVAYPSQALQASSGVPPYTWSLTAGSLPTGFNPFPSSGVISGTPQESGVFPFTVQVKDSSTPTPQTASANLSITVDPGITDNSKLSGNYAFSVRGFDPNGPQLPLFVAAGSFVADGNGNITSGGMDINNTANDPANPTFTGTYVIFQNGLGFLYLNIAGLGNRTFAISMMASGNANIIEFDDSNGGGTRNSGVLLKQEPGPFSPSSISGNYAFGFLGIDSGKNRFGLAGEFVADGGGNFTSGLLDSDDAVSGPSGNLPFLSGSSYTVAPNGRGTANIKTAQGTTGYTFYIVNSSQLLVVETDNFRTGGNPLVGGTILGQTSNSTFNSTSVFELTALSPSGPTAESQVGLFEANTGSFNLTESDQNTGGTLTQPTGSGTYTIANGRVALVPSPTTGSGFQNTTPTSLQPVLYMVSDNAAFIIGADTAVSFGFMTPQVQPGTYTSASLSGTYAGGSLAPVDPSVSNVVSIAIAGSNTLNVTADASGPNGLSYNQVAATTAVAPSGRVAVTESGNSTAEILYLVSPPPVPPAQGPPGQFFLLSGQGDPTARVDIFQQ